MVLNHKWMIVFLNAALGGGYIALILLMIHWASTGNMGMIAFLIPIGLLAALTLGWTVLDKRKISSPQISLVRELNG